MSRFNTGGKSIIKLDASGNIDTSKLESELRSALEFDVRYRQQDNMKKKAVKVSGSYDEFKAMVACAHLKTLSSKEVQSLAAPKKGWQKSHVAADSTSATVTLQQEQRAAEAASVAGGSGSIAMPAGLSSSSSSDATAVCKVITVAPNNTFPRPKSALALERDLQKLSVPGQRTCYLAQLGHKRVHKLLKGDAGCDVLELVLSAILHSSSSAANKADEAAPASKESNITDSPQSSAPVQETEDGAGAAAEIETETELSSLQRFEWLAAATRFDRFSVSVHFVPAPLLEAVRAWLGSLGSTLEGEGVGPEAVADVLASFSKR